MRLPSRPGYRRRRGHYSPYHWQHFWQVSLSNVELEVVQAELDKARARDAADRRRHVLVLLALFAAAADDQLPPDVVEPVPLVTQLVDDLDTAPCAPNGAGVSLRAA